MTTITNSRSISGDSAIILTFPTDENILERSCRPYENPNRVRIALMFTRMSAFQWPGNYTSSIETLVLQTSFIVNTENVYILLEMKSLNHSVIGYIHL